MAVDEVQGTPAGGDPSAVTLLLVSHDGAAWLPTVIDGVLAQTAPPAHVVAVDTGSRDGSADLVEERLAPVRSAPAATGYPEAVALGLDVADSLAPPTPWVWLLHDDSAPSPGALEALLAAAAADPRADVLGPTLREWPSLRRLLEVGVTVSGTGRRETGLETGEYDQGQHDAVREVLAVNTAGMLVRRSVLDALGGLEPQLPVLGGDLDLGWRAASAGHRVVAVPGAVVFHVEAARRGLRPTSPVGADPHVEERRAGLFTVLANSAPGAPLLQVPRIVVGTLLRVLGFLLVREPGRSVDELTALAAVLAHPGRLLSARRARAAARTAPRARVRRLLAPWWTPYRHGLDVLTDLASALSVQAGDVAERRRAAAAGHDPSSFAARRLERAGPGAEGDDGVEGAAEDTGLVARFLTNPVAVVLALVVVLAVVASRHALGSVTGPGLSPAPGSVHDWWTLHLQERHPLLQGTSVPAPAHLLPLAVLGLVLGGSATAAVSAVLLACVPLALWGAWRFLRVLGRLVAVQGIPRWLVLWGSATYAVTPLVSGAWGQGRLGPVVVATLLPWLGHAVLGFADPEADRRWRAAWRGGLLLSVVVAFAPVLWWVVVLLVLVVLGLGLALVPSVVRERSTWGPLATWVLTPVALLAPWWVWSLAHGAADGLLLDVGRLPGVRLEPLSLLAGRLGGVDPSLGTGGAGGAPAWVGLVLPVLALVALLPRRSRLGVALCWAVAAVTGLVAAVLARLDLHLAAAVVHPGLGVVPVLLQATFVVAVVLGAQAALTGPTRVAARPAPLRVGAAVLAAAAVVVPVVGLGWLVVDAPGLDADAGVGADIPAYMVQSAQQGPEHGILVLRGDGATGLTYTVRRGDGTTLGQDEVLALTGEDRGFTRDVRAFVSRPTPATVDVLAANGIEYVVLPSPADSTVAAALDATTGLVQAGAEDRRTRAWQVDRPLRVEGVEGRTSWLRTGVVVLQVLAVLAVLVLCAPTRRRSTP